MTPNLLAADAIARCPERLLIDQARRDPRLLEDLADCGRGGRLAGLDVAFRQDHSCRFADAPISKSSGARSDPQ